MYSGHAGFPITDFENPGPDRRNEVRFFVTELLPVRGGEDRLRAHNPAPRRLAIVSRGMASTFNGGLPIPVWSLNRPDADRKLD